MSNWNRRGARIIGVVGLTAAIAVSLAAPASAAPNDTSSFGVKCGGVVKCGPFAASAFPGGPASNSLATVNVAGLVSTGLINTSANSNGANASVNQVNVILTSLATLTATTVSSQCSITDTGGVTGSSSIVGGQIVIIGGTPITLATAPAPNTTVLGLTGIASVVLNRQSTDTTTGALTVDAIFITLLNGQTVTIASSTCTPTGTGVPMASGTGLLLGGGMLGMLVLGYAIRRRSLSRRQLA